MICLTQSQHLLFKFFSKAFEYTLNITGEGELFYVGSSYKGKQSGAGIGGGKLSKKWNVRARFCFYLCRINYKIFISIT